jgi:uncharacterized repeat protein (TIGR02543 family)
MKKKLFLLLVITLILTIGLSGCSQRYMVAFDSRGGNEVSPIRVKEGSTINLPTPVKEGHTFTGWFTDSSLGMQYTNQTPITSSITLFAAWRINTYKIEFDSNGGSNVTPRTAIYDSTINLPFTPSKIGHSFTGWYLDQELNEPFVLSSKMPAEDLTLYAKWTINQYTITFNSNQGSAINPIIAQYGENIEEPEDPSRLGYNFVGWYAIHSSNKFDFNTMPASNKTLYAKWAAKTYLVYFDFQGATQGTSPINKLVSYDHNYGVLPSPSKTGHTFQGWYTASSGGQKVDSTTKVSITSPQYLYARWSTNSYTMTFTSNGGSAVSPLTQPFGSNVSAPINPQRVGYSFDGWYSDSQLTLKYNFTTMPAQNITLYAKWIIN